MFEAPVCPDNRVRGQSPPRIPHEALRLMATTYPVSRWKIGAAAITRVVEIEGDSPGTFFFEEATPERLLQHAWLRPHFLTGDGRVIASIHCFVIESAGRTIVVDTCVGNDKPREVKAWHMRQGRFLEDLAEAGFPRERVDTVLCTHLHVDHVGWNTMLAEGKWVPTFPNARYLLGKKEWAHWSNEPEGPDREVRNDSVRPILEAGLADLVATDHRITPEVCLEPTPGHTPHHQSLLLESDGARVFYPADLMPTSAHIPLPWIMGYDVEPLRTLESKRWILRRAVDEDWRLVFEHDAYVMSGRVAVDGKGYGFRVEGSGQRAAG